MPSPAERLLNANRSPRCQHTKWNGEPCGSPALQGQPYCFFHHEPHTSSNDHRVPFIEDAATVQIAVMRVIRSLEERIYDTKTCALMLYALQIASSNLKRLKEEGKLSSTDRDQSFAELVLERFDLLDTVEGNG